MRIFIILISLLAPHALSAHPSHFTTAELEWNGPIIEVSLHLPAADLLKAMEADPAHGDYERNVQALIRKHISLTSPKGESLPLEWIGLEDSKFGCWVHFQWKVKTPTESHSLRNTLFFRTEPRFTHRMNVKTAGGIKTLIFRQDSTEAVMPVPDSEGIKPASDKPERQSP